MLEEPRHRGVSGLVDGDGAFFLLGHHLRGLLQTADNAVHGIDEVLFAHLFRAVACGNEGRFVADVGDVGAREARCLPGEEFDIEVRVELERGQVYLEDSHAFGEFGQVHVDLSVKSSGAEEGVVEDFHAVGGGEHNHARVGAEAVHFGEQLVERVLALVVASHGRTLAAGAADGVNLVDENDAGRLLLGLLEEVAHAARADAHEHLHEVGTRHGEEGHFGLAGHGLGEEGLARARRAHEQGSLGYLAAELGELLGAFKELNDFLHLLLRAFEPGHVLERDIGTVLAVFLDDAGLALAYAEDAARGATRSHAAEHVEPEEDEQEDGEERAEQLQEIVAALLVAHDALVVFVEEVRDFIDGGILGRDGGSGAHLVASGLEDLADVLRLHHEAHLALALVDHHLAGIALLHIGAEGGIVYLLFLAACAAGIALVEHDGQAGDDGEVDPGEVEPGLFPRGLLARLLGVRLLWHILF